MKGCESEKQSPVFFSCLAFLCRSNLTVEYLPSKQKEAGSSPVSCSKVLSGTYRSLRTGCTKVLKFGHVM